MRSKKEACIETPTAHSHSKNLVWILLYVTSVSILLDPSAFCAFKLLKVNGFPSVNGQPRKHSGMGECVFVCVCVCVYVLLNYMKRPRKYFSPHFPGTWLESLKGCEQTTRNALISRIKAIHLLITDHDVYAVCQWRTAMRFCADLE